MNAFAAKPKVSQRGPVRRATLAARSMLVFVLMIPLGAFGQTQGRNLAGTVKSVSGSPVPNVRVSAKNLANGNGFSAGTAVYGSYKLLILPRGIYEVFAFAS